MCTLLQTPKHEKALLTQFVNSSYSILRLLKYSPTTVRIFVYLMQPVWCYRQMLSYRLCDGYWATDVVRMGAAQDDNFLQNTRGSCLKQRNHNTATHTSLQRASRYGQK